MRDGRRKRLGLVEGSEGTVGDTYLDRILTDTEAANTRNVVKADPNVNFDAGNYNYVTDLYDYFSSGGAEEDTTPVVTPPSDGGGGGGDGGTSVGSPGTGGTTPGNTDFEDYLLDEGIGIQDKPGDPVVAPGEIPYTQDEMDEFNEIPVNPNYNLIDEGIGVQLEPGAPVVAPGEIPITQDEMDKFNYDGDTYAGSGDSKDTRDPDLLDAAGGEMGGADGYGIIEDTPIDYSEIDYSEFDDLEADAGSIVTAEDVQDEQKFMDKFKGLLPENFDFKTAAIKGLISSAIGQPLFLAIDILKGIVPQRDPKQNALDELYDVKDGTIQSGLMQGYNPVSGNPLDPNYGLQDAYQKRIETIEKTLANKYSDGDYTDTELDERLAELKAAKEKEKSILDNLQYGNAEEIKDGIDAADDDSEDDMLDALEPEDIDDASDGDLSNPGGGIDISGIEAEDEEEDLEEDLVDVEAIQANIKKAEKAEADRVEKANKAAADKAKAAKEAEIEANQQKAKEEADRIQNEKKAAKALADKAKAEADMQQKIKDQEKAQKQKEQNDYNDKIEKAIEDAKKDPTSGMGSCFIAGTKVTMADGTLKNIEDVEVGDKVKGHKEENTVIKLDPTLLADRKLYSFNNNEHYFFTSEHPFMTEEGWKSIKPEKTKERDGIELYKQLKGELKVGDKLVTDNDSIEITDIKSKEMNNPEMPLYNFNVSNDSSYIADDYVVHNKGCFIKGTLITMADGTTKPVEQVDLGDEVAVGGKVFAVGRFLNTELYEYKGIKVSGSHMVNEDGTWMRVRDTKHGKSLGDDQNTVYVFGSENRRILINGILFTDYFEVNEQDMLMNDEKDFFNNSKKYGKVIDEHNVEILNAN